MMTRTLAEHGTRHRRSSGTSARIWALAVGTLLGVAAGGALTPAARAESLDGAASASIDRGELRSEADPVRLEGPGPSSSDAVEPTPSPTGSATPRTPGASAPSAGIPGRSASHPAPVSPTPASPLNAWTQLRYTTSKLLIFTGDLTMARTVSGDTTKVRTDSEARLFGAPFLSSWSVSTMDRATGRPLEFLEVRPGKKADRFDFTEKGIEQTTLKPHKKGSEEPIESWKASDTKILSGPAPVEPVSPVDPSTWIHDYISMIVRLHDLPLSKVGDQATVRISTSKGPAPMRISVSEERTERRTLTDLSANQKRTLEFHELRLRVTPLAGSPSDTRGFLDMEGETELWIDAASRTLTEISGDVPKVPGRVVITLAGYR